MPTGTLLPVATEAFVEQSPSSVAQPVLGADLITSQDICFVRRLCKAGMSAPLQLALRHTSAMSLVLTRKTACILVAAAQAKCEYPWPTRKANGTQYTITLMYRSESGKITLVDERSSFIITRHTDHL